MKTSIKSFRKHVVFATPIFSLHHPEKSTCGILLCLLLFIPCSAFSADTAPFSKDSLPDKLQNTTFRMQTKIWNSGVGEGFRSGTQVVGLSAGATYGILIFGGEERHHLSLISASYGQIIGDVRGADKWYRGNLELRVELFGGAQFNSETRGITGVTQHVRYHFATGTRLIPYIDAGVGLSVTEIRGQDLGGAFQFNEQAIIGVNYFVKDNLSINIAMQYFHVSSASIYWPNNGVNTVGGFLGMQWFF
jgi:lipid A 3-O-deacylase